MCSIFSGGRIRTCDLLRPSQSLPLGYAPLLLSPGCLGGVISPARPGTRGASPRLRPRRQNADLPALSPRQRHNTICIRSRRPTRLGHVPGIGAGGVEPPASAFVVRCSIHLSYAPGCRGGRIRTCDLLVPNQARCQIAPRLDDMQLCAIHPRHWHIPLTKCVYLAPWLPSETDRGCGRSQGDGPRLPLATWQATWQESMLLAHHQRVPTPRPGRSPRRARQKA